jgi:isoleucyl-tRNA synthetase
MDEKTQKIIPTGKSPLAEREEKILEFWNANSIFDKSLTKNSPKGEFIFYEGPPTANGKPGIHHLEARAFKDIIPRYKTMQGFHVRRKGGWDTHGLPVELQVEKELGLKSKKEIETYGVAAFNKKCKESVWQYLDIWNKFTNRIGYWIDQENPYITYENTYIESLWSVVGEIYKKNLLYKDYKVVPWCPRCGTALSSHELAQGYQDDKDLSVTAKFKLKDFPNAYFLAWTTTPWTLPGNVALAVGADIEYVEAKVGEEIYVLAKERLSIISEPYEILATHKGSEMVGMAYEPLYPYLSNLISKEEKPKLEKAYKVYAADFVTTKDGTGIVHTAVMYGQDDFVLGTTIGLPKYHLVDDGGHFIQGTDFLGGRFVKDEEVAIDIIKDLAHRGLLFKKEKYEHPYPHCWRCKTPLIYYARDSWYIKMSSLRDKLVRENEKINWEPGYIKDGRFGEWLSDVKDWAISRERYWGTPLPIWETEDGKRVVIDSIDALKKYVKKSGNNYFVMRHGGTEGNKSELVSYKNEAADHLTEEGKIGVSIAAKTLKKKNIDLVVYSPFSRTKETAEIVQSMLGLTDNQMIPDKRLIEVNPGDFDGKKWYDYHDYLYGYGSKWYDHSIPHGESLKDVQKRTGSVLYDLEKKYEGKNILIVTHGGPGWLLYVNAGLFLPFGQKYKKADTYAFIQTFKRFDNAEVRELPFVPLPHNEDFSIDLHKPYIDDIALVDEEGNALRRVKEMMDVWFDSGAMPFAQDHYPFAFPKTGLFGHRKKPLYPADFISEAIDQTRGWFYTLHAVGNLMGWGRAYKNVICLGHILDKDGKKMSKSLGNIIDPWDMIEKYGVDPLRFWMYSVNQPGESKNFEEKTVVDGVRKVFNLLDNVYVFYELYRDKSLETNQYPKSADVLDQWILSKLSYLVEMTERNLDAYKVLEPARAMRDFIDDLSTWYLRRSRDRLKDGNTDAKETLYYVLKTLIKVMAPFTPFIAEDIYQKLKLANDPESVHLCEWPKMPKGNLSLINEMENVREIVRQGLEARQKANIKVRQPLQSLSVPVMDEAFTSIVKDELNVKDIHIGNTFNLDTVVTPQLRKEGDIRDLIRFIQDMRKEKGLLPKDEIMLIIDTTAQGKVLVEEFEEEIQKTVGAKTLEFGVNFGKEIKIGENTFKVSI